ncbi:MAG: hypothetical protein E7653_06205 [Ruminococcaceae bacterium]|nr:hypothetical protein [Oscillospiraceae bacterium]
MLKGINRNVIVVRTEPNSKFEAVYFVLRKGGASERADVVKEANKIINDSGAHKRYVRRGLRTALLVACSAILGAVLSLLVCLLAFL